YAMPVGAPEIDDPNPTFEHAVALWLAPGTTRVRADGALASDHAGLPLSLLALLLGAALAWPPTRALLTSLARPFLEARALGPLVALALAAVLGALVVRARAPVTESLHLTALRPTPRLFVVDAGGQRACTPSSWGRVFRCPDGAVLRSIVSYTLRDWHVGWPVPAPALELSHASLHARYLLELDDRTLEGPSYLQCEHCVATLRTADGESAARVDERTSRLTLFVSSPRLELRALAPTASFTWIGARFVEPELAPPLPPAAP
ncbi:MAG: hypothetical protein K1X94_31545, partial [Sandaracinaceae bacterium]|nr:hypothetical protein [Sandaracinaceae bacterium]